MPEYQPKYIHMIALYPTMGAAMLCVSCSRPKNAIPIPAIGTKSAAGGTTLRIKRPNKPRNIEMRPVIKFAASATFRKVRIVSNFSLE